MTKAEMTGHSDPVRDPASLTRKFQSEVLVLCVIVERNTADAVAIARDMEDCLTERP